MKKVATIIVLALLTSLTIQAQHLSFKGIPLEGTLQAFASKLVGKGFKQVGKQEGIVILNGPFAGYQKCEIGLVGNAKGNIFKVVVIFPKHNKWGDVEKDYYQLKELLTQKYGQTSTVIEDLDETDDWMKLYKISESEASFGCEWTVEGGSIELQISKTDYMEAAVFLSYFDQSGQQEAIQSAIDDL